MTRGCNKSTPNMTGRPGCRTMEMIGGSSASYLARTPLFCTSCNGVETEGFLDYQGRAGIISIVRWNLRPVIFGVEQTCFWQTVVLSPAENQGFDERGANYKSAPVPSVTRIGSLPLENPADPRRARRTLEETPGEAPENPLRGKFPRRASRRVVPLGW